jgi:hypothetical protein
VWGINFGIAIGRGRPPSVGVSNVPRFRAGEKHEPADFFRRTLQYVVPRATFDAHSVRWHVVCRLKLAPDFRTNPE